MKYYEQNENKNELQFSSPKTISIVTILIMLFCFLYIRHNKSQRYKNINILWLGFMFGWAFPIYYNIYLLNL